MNDDFTPGPWVLYDTSAGQSMRVGLPYKGAPAQTIALVIRPIGTTDDEQVANAHLISSAPELLAALIAVLNNHPGTKKARTDAARAAIAKAAQS